MSVAAALVAPLRDPASYRRLAFLASATPLAGIWLGLLSALWAVTLSLAITPLVVPALIATSLGVRAAALVEGALAGALLDAELQRPAMTISGGGFWRSGLAVLSDGAFWRMQAYLALRSTAGFALSVALLTTIGVGLGCVAAPTYYWAVHPGIGPHAYPVNTLAEALSRDPRSAAAAARRAPRALARGTLA